jgi:hypothetical protein
VSKNDGGGIRNTLKIKSKNRYDSNMKNKIRDRYINKKEDMSYRTMCNYSDVSFGGYKTFYEMKEAA